jgi:PAS domain S-box-containing protein
MCSIELAFRNIFDHSSDGFILINGDGAILQANRAALDLFGIDAALLAETYVQSLVAEDSPGVNDLLSAPSAAETRDVSFMLANGQMVRGTLAHPGASLFGGLDDCRMLIVPATQHAEAKHVENDDEDGAIAVERRFALLAEASRIFTEAGRDLGAVMDTVSRALATSVGDTCVIRLISDDGLWLDPVAVYHRDPVACELARTFNATFKQSADDGPAGVVVRTSKALLVPHVDQREIRRTVRAEYVAYLDQVGVSSLIMAPLRVQGRVIGTLGLARDNGRQPYSADDATLVQDLADRAALAVENARLYGEIQEELAERKMAEERYRVVTRVTSDAVWDWDMVRDVLWRSPSVRTLFGHIPDEVVSSVTWWFNHIHPEDRDRVEQSVRTAIGGGEQFWSNEYRFLKSDGEYAYILDRAQLIWSDGVAVRMIGAMTDITQQKETELALRISERKYRTLIEHSPDVTRISNASGNLLYISPNVERVYGYSEKEIIARSPEIWREIIHPDDIAEIANAYHVLFTERKPYTMVYRMRRKDGRYIWILDRTNTPYEMDGQLYVDGVCSDITEQKEAEASVKLFRTLMNQSDDTLLVVDAERGRFVDVNDVGCARLGYSRAEFLGLHVSDVETKLPSVASWERLVAHLREKGSEIMEGEHRRRDGSTFPVEVNVKYIEIDKRAYHVAVARDITERKRAEEAMRRAHDILAKRVEEKTNEISDMMHRMEEARTSQRRFVAGASHDLRTPLTIVRAELDLLRRRPEHDVHTRESLDRIHNESKRLDRLASDLLLLATLDSLNPDERRHEVHLEELVIDCVSEISLLGEERDLVWNIQFGDVPPLTCARQMIHRALLNLLDNAITYSTNGGTLTVALSSDDEYVELAVEDSGCGIAPEDLPKVFDRFYRTDPARSSGGSGLGLAIVKSVAEAHGGEVAIESEIGRGTIVRMRLPLGAVGDDPEESD